jgi:hypothetical protein
MLFFVRWRILSLHTIFKNEGEPRMKVRLQQGNGRYWLVPPRLASLSASVAVASTGLDSLHLRQQQEEASL